MKTLENKMNAFAENLTNNKSNERKRILNYIYDQK